MEPLFLAQWSFGSVASASAAAAVGFASAPTSAAAVDSICLNCNSLTSTQTEWKPLVVWLLVVDFSPGWAHFGPLLGEKILQIMTNSNSAPNSILGIRD